MSGLADTLLHWRRWTGAALREWPRYRRALSQPGAAYLELHNRNERLEAAPAGAPGLRCQWQWTSDLHAPRMLPHLGLALLRRALSDHPVLRAPEPAQGQPAISFIIGHRGGARLPHLLATLETIAAQRDACIECIVVEQDDVPSAAARLPAWVRHVHTPPPDPAMPYSRAWAFNIGVRHARADTLVLHDNDMLVSADYAACVLRHIREGCELVNLKRFVFYLDEAHTRAVLDACEDVAARPPLAVTQNLEGGGSIAITREAYQRIGGMDESFIGWGGEDNEFWERAQVLRVWPYAYLPIVHLWHAPQPGKLRADNPTLEHYRRLSATPVAQRIEHLRRLPSADLASPLGWQQGNAKNERHATPLG